MTIHGPGNDNYPMQKGSKGNRVIQLQLFLNRAGAGLTADGAFGAKTESALKSLYGQTSVKDYADLQALYKKEAAKNYKPAPAKPASPEVKEAAKANVGFDAMLKTDAATYVQLSTLNTTLDGFYARLKKHTEKLKATPYKTGDKFYGDFKTPTEARLFAENVTALIKVYSKISASYAARQKDYENNKALKASKAVAKATDALTKKATAVLSKAKAWFGLSGTDGLGLPVLIPVLVVVGAVVTFAIAKYYIDKYGNPTIADAEQIQKAIADAHAGAKEVTENGKELIEESKQVRSSGDIARADKLENAGIELVKQGAELEKQATSSFTTQQAADIKERDKSGESFLDNITKNAGNLLLVAGGGVLLYAATSTGAVSNAVRPKSTPAVSGVGKSKFKTLELR